MTSIEQQTRSDPFLPFEADGQTMTQLNASAVDLFRAQELQYQRQSPEVANFPDFGFLSDSEDEFVYWPESRSSGSPSFTSCSLVEEDRAEMNMEIDESDDDSSEECSDEDSDSEVSMLRDFSPAPSVASSFTSAASQSPTTSLAERVKAGRRSTKSPYSAGVLSFRSRYSSPTQSSASTSGSPPAIVFKRSSRAKAQERNLGSPYAVAALGRSTSSTRSPAITVSMKENFQHHIMKEYGDHNCDATPVPSGPHQCPSFGCDKRFETMRGALYHMKLGRNERDPVHMQTNARCPSTSCSMRANVHILERHICRIDHESIKRICDRCGHNTSRASSVSRHKCNV